MRRFVWRALLLGAFLCLHIWMTAGFSAWTPRLELNAVDAVQEDSATLTARLPVEFSPSGSREEAGVAGDFPVTVCVTDANALRYEGISMLRGSFLTENGSGEAVISEGLSLSLFQTIDTVGQSVPLNGGLYTVVGVYRQDALITQFCTDGTEKVYLRQGAQDPERILLSAPAEDIFFRQRAEGALKNAGGNSNQWLVQDYSAGPLRVGQPLQLYYQLLKALLVIFLGYVLFLDLRREYGRCRRGLTAQYLPAYVNENSIRLLLHGIAWIFCLFIILFFLLSLWRYEPYFPQSFFPVGSLFDFAHYRDLFLQALRESRAQTIPGASWYQNALNLTQPVSWFLCALEAWLTIHLTIMSGEKAKRFWGTAREV